MKIQYDIAGMKSVLKNVGYTSVSLPSKAVKIRRRAQLIQKAVANGKIPVGKGRELLGAL